MSQKNSKLLGEIKIIEGTKIGMLKSNASEKISKALKSCQTVRNMQE